MKYLLLLIVSVMGYSQSNREYQIAEKALLQLHNYVEYSVMAVPNNSVISHYMNGFSIGDFNFNNVRFEFDDVPVAEWEVNKNDWARNIIDKIKIVKDYTLRTNGPEPFKSYLILSNPAFSADGIYAIISIDFISPATLNATDNQVYVFKNNNNNWKYIGNFTGMLY